METRRKCLLKTMNYRKGALLLWPRMRDDRIEMPTRETVHSSVRCIDHSPDLKKEEQKPSFSAEIQACPTIVLPGASILSHCPLEVKATSAGGEMLLVLPARSFGSWTPGHIKHWAAPSI